MGNRLGPAPLSAFASALDRIGLDFRDPPAPELATWVARGLRAEQAAGPALASFHDLRLLSVDPLGMHIAHALLRDPD